MWETLLIAGVLSFARKAAVLDFLAGTCGEDLIFASGEGIWQKVS
jgi:hypothetical protein